jgi:hypothetical protein
MRKNGHSWLIADIYLDGAISEVATRRSEFAAILRKNDLLMLPASSGLESPKVDPRSTRRRRNSSSRA